MSNVWVPLSTGSLPAFSPAWVVQRASIGRDLSIRRQYECFPRPQLNAFARNERRLVLYVVVADPVLDWSAFWCLSVGDLLAGEVQHDYHLLGLVLFGVGEYLLVFRRQVTEDAVDLETLSAGAGSMARSFDPRKPDASSGTAKSVARTRAHCPHLQLDLPHSNQDSRR